MQDVVTIKGMFRGDKNQDMFALFDGHGGRYPSSLLFFSSSNLPSSFILTIRRAFYLLRTQGCGVTLCREASIDGRRVFGESG